MKTIYLILCVLILPVIATAQDAVVAAVKMNVLYRGIDNPVEIAVPGVTSDKIMATITNGIITRTSNGWSVAPGSQNESVISVAVNNKKIAEKSFRIKSIPVPEVFFADKNEGTISKEIALKTETLDVVLRDFAWDLKFTIQSFSLAINKDQYDYEESAVGNKITDKMRSLINTLQPGRNLVFLNIKVLGPDGKNRDMKPIVLKIM
jgi:hypothetical protein